MRRVHDPRPRLKSGVVVDADGCWVWQRAVDPTGYGRISVGTEMVYAHRASYECFVGPMRRTNLMRGNTLARAHHDGVDCGHAKCPNCRRFRVAS